MKDSLNGTEAVQPRQNARMGPQASPTSCTDRLVSTGSCGLYHQKYIPSSPSCIRLAPSSYFGFPPHPRIAWTGGGLNMLHIVEGYIGVGQRCDSEMKSWMFAAVDRMHRACILSFSGGGSPFERCGIRGIRDVREHLYRRPSMI